MTTCYTRSLIASLGFLVLSVPNFALAKLPCKLSPVVSKHPIAGSKDVGFGSVRYVVHPSWDFTELADAIRVTEKLDIEFPRIQGVLARAVASQMPNQDCHVTSSLHGPDVSSPNGDLAVHFSFSATKWACPGTNVPCPTWSKPFRMCYKRLTKTILAKGVGTFDVKMHPELWFDQIKIETTSPRPQFHLDRGTGFLVIPVVGQVIGLVVSKINLFGNVPLLYPKVSIPLSGGREGRAPIQLDWHDSKVYFGVAHGRISLTRERHIDVSPHTACYLRTVFSKL